MTNHDINGAKLLTRLRLNFNHLNQQKLRHNFNDIIHPISSCDASSCGAEAEKTLHYHLSCDLHFTYRLGRLNDIYVLNMSFKTILKIIS